MPDYSALKNQILNDIQQNPTLGINKKMLDQKIKKEIATYDDAVTFSRALGNSASKSIESNIANDIADNELEQFATECLAPVYQSCQDTMLDASGSIQMLYNKQAGINLNPVAVQRDQDRIDNIIKRFKEATSFADVAFLTGENTAQSITRGAVNDSISENAKFQENVGMDVYLSRSDKFGCCDWCASVCGTFKSFEALSDGFWGVHRGCTCVIDYRVGKTKSRLSYTTGKEGKLSKITENEESNKQLKSLDQSTLINKEYIKSNEYRRKLNQLISDVEERRAVESASKDILDHRNGTHFEDLAFIDTSRKNGKTIINKDYDFYDPVEHISQCVPNKPMKEMLSNAKEYTIIGIHNHPSNNAPSIKDIYAARDRKYKYGIVVCHNGTVYRYSVSPEFEDDFNADIALADLQESFYNNRTDDVKSAIKSLAKLGIKIEVI